ncbi:50S ribosomal protein L18 [Candidatus Giovannonibacteria bacterium RIFCSPHIGHO2_02_43_13]|uniref:Large ribosomal subunit protein uL18 n=1 Tax=Candidatus Giovannonibacteria bacterium RIFCSPHIGHO2_02_43_13 TaxID=1798330 RepID=A0A1F5WVP9_9BACT|nr:MAG: 50S ribosomal protein L18 [Parcubacteria group bacterium GW2011_GWA2_44_13]OGF71776.1 MAG: 50S ribosomal protein L18 [Candidatus Giovannonibacteria bacterium RIFCSPHIGHO2_12_FULL_44_42]OGF79391.1 MAG: 50S ribosomal protein L18 [Candidatus Giovannonibacteria bacterium RIFCSPHIGHO2_02_43_13]OGF89908.1 MAG: 50S ribosomal protein L18 [Candidatus Giovannonibacteria bacterium RIFCSPLOWO2_02_FULL_43_54]OGF97358.1 MAG: 50S ribosomal protein L18 [Candidatus Giovannonibacteria bacterium RIFCSPLOW
MKQRINKRTIRHRRVRAKIFGSAERPRLSLYRSNKHLFLQLIDDEKNGTLLGLRDDDLTGGKKNLKKTDKAFEAGKAFAKFALEKGIKEAVFDRGGYRYQGRVRRLAEGAREGGLKF